MNIDDFIENPHPFLDGMSELHLRILAENATKTHFAPGEIIFRQGESANRFYLIEHGEVALQTHAAGRLTTVQTIGPGEALGWSWLFPPHHWLCDARAQKESWAISMDALSVYVPGLLEKSEVDTALGYELMKRVAKTVVHRLHSTRLKFIQASISNTLPTV